jgi:porin
MNARGRTTAASLTAISLAYFFFSIAAGQETGPGAQELQSSPPPEAISPGEISPEASASPDKKFSLVEASPSLIPVSDYRGGLWTRRAMTGDWGGYRQTLLENGVTTDVTVTQILQGNAYGGLTTYHGLQYSGSADYYFNLDTGRAGLWPGGLVKVHGQTEFGRGVGRKVGAILPVNYQSLLPVPGDPGETTLSEVYLMQALSKYLLVTIGKWNPQTFGDTNVFANDQQTQFMNTGLVNNPVLFPFMPYTTIGTFLAIMPLGTDDLIIGPFFGGTTSMANQSGFNTWLDQPYGTTTGGEVDVKVRPFRLPGNIRLGGVWSNKHFFDLAQDRRLLIEDFVLGRTPEKVDGSYALYGNFDQYVYMEDEETKQGLGLFGRLGFAPERTNVLNWFYSLGVGGKGVVPRRDEDTFGVGYYFAEVSDDFTKGPILPNLNPEQGIEAYYNIQLTPWMQLTPDLQCIINPAVASMLPHRAADRRFSLVLGGRLQMEF